MEDNENTYVIPANFTESNKIFGGLINIRNAFEAIVIVLIIGFLEARFFAFSETVKIVFMSLTLIPIGVFSLIGIDGDSILQFVKRLILFNRRKRKVHFRRIGVDNENK